VRRRDGDRARTRPQKTVAATIDLILSGQVMLREVGDRGIEASELARRGLAPIARRA
jgi:hypothetical protein